MSFISPYFLKLSSLLCIEPSLSFVTTLSNVISFTFKEGSTISLRACDLVTTAAATSHFTSGSSGALAPYFPQSDRTEDHVNTRPPLGQYNMACLYYHAHGCPPDSPIYRQHIPGPVCNLLLFYQVPSNYDTTTSCVTQDFNSFSLDPSGNNRHLVF